MPLYRKNAIFGPNRFTKLWIVICKSLSKYKIMRKIILKYCVYLDLYTKNAILGQNLPHLPNFWRLANSFQKFFKSPIFFPEFVSACQKLA